MKFLASIAIVVLVWLVGLFAFAERVRGSTPAEDPERADGIVALTGASDERIAAAMRLLEHDKADRMLVSGVNPEVRRVELREITPGSNRLFDCCVDLGFDATDTVGNAQETAAWAKAKGYDSLIVVTSDYHMPRSLLEIRGAARGVKLIPHAVRTPSLDSSRWWRSERGLRRMTVEYCKYLAVLVREGVRSIVGGGKADTPSDNKAEKTG